jgi:hypothetical protein
LYAISVTLRNPTWLIRPHLQPPKDHKSSIVIFVIPVGTDGRTDGRTDKSCQKLQQRRRKTVWRLWQLFLPQFKSGVVNMCNDAGYRESVISNYTAKPTTQEYLSHLLTYQVD